jgi:tetratricopeptide (TPR) repeat protein
MRSLRRAAAVLVAIALSSPDALAGPPDHEPPVDDDGGGTVDPVTAEDWLRLGLTRFEREDYSGAIDAFKRGNAIDPRPQFLFAIAQAERLRGDCKAALVYYRRFLTTSPPEEQAAAATQHLRRCSAVVSAAPTPAPEAAPPPPPPPPVEPEPEAPPFWSDPITLAVGGGAVALSLTGAAFLVAAGDASDDAATAATYDEHASLLDRAASRQRIGLITLSAGVAVGGYAIYRILRGGEAPRREEKNLTVTPGPGVGLALGGRF